MDLNVKRGEGEYIIEAVPSTGFDGFIGEHYEYGPIAVRATRVVEFDEAIAQRLSDGDPTAQDQLVKGPDSAGMYTFWGDVPQ